MNDYKIKYIKNCISISALILSVGLMIFLFVGYIIISFGKRSKPEASDCIIVLGCRLYETEPSPFLKARLDEGYRLYKEGYGNDIIVSGGKGPGETITEAEAMRDYLISKGVDPYHILIEDKSFSTLENLKNSKKIMDERNLKSAVIVSNEYHLKRSSMIAKKIGIKGSYSGVFVSKHINSEIKGFLREIAALIFFYIKI